MPITITTIPAQHQLQLLPVVVMPLLLLQLHPQVAILQVHVRLPCLPTSLSPCLHLMAYMCLQCNRLLLTVFSNCK